MDRLEALEAQARRLGVIVDSTILRETDGLDGLYLAWPEGAIILVNAHRSRGTQAIALAEEIGHHLRTCGNVIRLDTVAARKGEMAGRAWSYRALMPPEKVAGAVRSGVCTPWELAEHFGVTDSFVRDALAYYQRKDALPHTCGWCSVS